MVQLPEVEIPVGANKRLTKKLKNWGMEDFEKL